jgi:hypothetical protein
MSVVASPIAAVPTLAQVVQDPARLERLPLTALLELQRQLGHLSVDVNAAITRRMALHTTPSGVPPERVMLIEEAAARLGMTKDYLYRNWLKLGGYKDDDGHVKFPLSAIERHVSRRVRS